MLGSGTSSGVPVIACECPVCMSQDPRNRRTRASILLEYGGRSVVIDTGPDFRMQALTAKLRRLDAVLFTHAHADHIFGLDDVRAFNFRQSGVIPCYGTEATLGQLRQAFAYIFEPTQEGGGKPRIALRPVAGEFDLFGHAVTPVPVLHGALEVLGYRFGRFAYITDCSTLPEASWPLLAGVDTLILGALRHRPHPTHFSISEAIEAAARIGARRVAFTHINHEIDHGAPGVELPPGVELGYDGLVFEVSP